MPLEVALTVYGSSWDNGYVGSLRWMNSHKTKEAVCALTEEIRTGWRRSI